MEAFSFVFSFFGLLLGFSLTALLGGFVRALKVRHKVGLGYLTPLLAIYMMLDITSFWIDAWNLRSAIPATSRSLVVGVVITSLYYFAASLVFPDNPEEFPEFDAYYFRHKRQIFGAMLVAESVAGFFESILPDHIFSADELILMLFMVGILSVPIFAKGRRTNLIFLCILLVFATFSMLTS